MLEKSTQQKMRTNQRTKIWKWVINHKAKFPLITIQDQKIEEKTYDYGLKRSIYSIELHKFGLKYRGSPKLPDNVRLLCTLENLLGRLFIFHDVNVQIRHWTCAALSSDSSWYEMLILPKINLILNWV